MRRFHNQVQQFNTEDLAHRKGHVGNDNYRGKGNKNHDTLSYKCKAGHHGDCTKLGCPCECHQRTVLLKDRSRQ